MPTEIIIRDGVVAKMSLYPWFVFDASKNSDSSNNYVWADTNLNANYNMDTRYNSTDTNVIIKTRNAIWPCVVSSPGFRYTGPDDIYYPNNTLGSDTNPNTIIAKITSPLVANTQYPLIQGCNTIRNINTVTSNNTIRRYAPNNISWFAYAMTMRKGTGTDAIIDCRAGRQYISVTITNFNYDVTHVFSVQQIGLLQYFYFDGTLIATINAIQISTDGYTYLNAPNKTEASSGADVDPFISTTLFGGTRALNWNSLLYTVDPFLNIYAILNLRTSIVYNFPQELQTLAIHRYAATSTAPVYTATAVATLSVSQVVVFNNATFSGTIKII